jgi:hypothetical protein
MMRWASKITTAQIGVVLQAVVVTVLGLTLVIGWSSWQAETSKQQTDATLRYFDRLMTRDYIQYLWEIQEFTVCFERAAKSHLSYSRFDTVRRQDEAYKTAARWWDLVENDQKELAGCGKPVQIEEKLMVVYGRLEALASCAKQQLCSFGRVVDMIEAVDYITLLSISNYLLLTRDRERRISREWYMSGALVDLVEVVERYVFEGRNSAMTYANLLDRHGSAPENSPILRPAEIDAIRDKRTRCDQVADTWSDDWRRCLSPERRRQP